MTVLVIDDAQTVRTYHRQILEKGGFEVAEAANGLEGLEYLYAHSGTVKAMLVDINMPQMDGYSFLREVRRQSELSAIPAVMISTESEMHDQDMAFQAGANGYFTKPVKPDSLIRRLMLMSGVAVDTSTQPGGEHHG